MEPLAQPLTTRVVTALSEVDPAAWNALVGEDDPFVEHGFLDALERSGSIAPEQGWQPVHLTVWRGDTLVGALPLYFKDHSFGEYIFDWAWADAARRLGSPYYPKLVSMVPVTPATGRRLLVGDDEDPEPIVSALLDEAGRLMRELGGSSLHLLFLSEAEQKRVVCCAPSETSLQPRLGFQYHFYNAPYANFDAFLAACRSSARKQIKRERRKVADSGLRIETKLGSELLDGEWHALSSFYRDTCARRGSAPYLTRTFFDMLPDAVGDRAVCVLAYDGADVVAGTLNFEKGSHLYGRYWGARADYDLVHFELCYYRLMERLIDRGMTRLEAGAQGDHKLKRGFLPRPIYSAHAVRHPALSDALQEFLPREAAAVQREMALLREHGPFRREETDARCS